MIVHQEVRADCCPAAADDCRTVCFSHYTASLCICQSGVIGTSLHFNLLRHRAAAIIADCMMTGGAFDRMRRERERERERGEAAVAAWPVEFLYCTVQPHVYAVLSSGVALLQLLLGCIAGVISGILFVGRGTLSC